MTGVSGEVRVLMGDLFVLFSVYSALLWVWVLSLRGFPTPVVYIVPYYGVWVFYLRGFPILFHLLFKHFAYASMCVYSVHSCGCVRICYCIVSGGKPYLS